MRRSHGLHHVVLDELTHELAAAWLTERHRRWPVCPLACWSPQYSAVDPERPPIDPEAFRKPFKERGLTAQQARQDRIRDEAALTANPVHLMRLFGHTTGTAMRYVAAAHPERTARHPQ